jgi:hypothetical protein
MLMRKHEKVPATQKQIGDIAGVLLGEMDFSKSEAQAIIGQLGKFRREVKVFYTGFKAKTSNDEPEFVVELDRWWKNFEKLFGKQPDFSDIVIPPKPEDLGPMRLIMVPKEIITWTGDKPLQGTMNALKKHFTCWQYADDLDESIVKNDRDPRNASYALWVKDVREADEENANQSANNLAAKNHLGLTILERMLLEADYFFEHGEHMDLQNVTLCAGSRYRVGYVPCARWYDSRFGVDWCGVPGRGGSFRSRSVRM